MGHLKKKPLRLKKALHFYNIRLRTSPLRITGYTEVARQFYTKEKTWGSDPSKQD